MERRASNWRHRNNESLHAHVQGKGEPCPSYMSLKTYFSLDFSSCCNNHQNGLEPHPFVISGFVDQKSGCGLAGLLLCLESRKPRSKSCNVFWRLCVGIHLAAHSSCRRISVQFQDWGVCFLASCQPEGSLAASGVTWTPASGFLNVSGASVGSDLPFYANLPSAFLLAAASLQLQVEKCVCF